MALLVGWINRPTTSFPSFLLLFSFIHLLGLWLMFFCLGKLSRLKWKKITTKLQTVLINVRIHLDLENFSNMYYWVGCQLEIIFYGRSRNKSTFDIKKVRTLIQGTKGTFKGTQYSIEKLVGYSVELNCWYTIALSLHFISRLEKSYLGKRLASLNVQSFWDADQFFSGKHLHVGWGIRVHETV